MVPWAHSFKKYVDREDSADGNSSFLIFITVTISPNFLEHKQDKINKDAFRLSFVYNSWIYFVFTG